MAAVVLKIYCFMKEHRRWCFLVFLVLTGLLALQVTRLDYKEDISDFLPLDSRNRDAMRIYQDISGANQLFALFECTDSSVAAPDMVVEAVNGFTEKLEKLDTMHLVKNVTAQIDLEHLSEITDFIYENIPCFLQEDDYQRFDSLLAVPDFYQNQLKQDKEMLMLPGGSLLADNIGRDPLNFFTPVVSHLQQSSGELNYEMYDGYIFSPDMKKAIVVVSSPFGSSETEKNSNLVNLMQECANETMADVADVDVHVTGGPAIAVGNSQQIKKDSFVSVGLAVIIILVLLLFAFRNVRNLVLIVISIGWGWLFGLGGLALVHDDVSIIVLGISSVILGIAVNYPLHLIAHLYHTTDMRTALREIVSPLIVGNVTTVGAFLCLIPLHSIALRDLGLFSSFLLIGTITFVLLFLPHLARPHRLVNNPLLDRISSIKLENRPLFVVVVVGVTLVLGYFSTKTFFDTNMNHINYMTEEQKEDMGYFQTMMTHSSDNQIVYVVSSAQSLDEALDHSLSIQPFLQELESKGEIIGHKGCSRFLFSRSEQRKRIRMWNDFVALHGNDILANLKRCSRMEGFAEDSFEDFYSILESVYAQKEEGGLDKLMNTMFTSNISIDSTSNSYDVVDILTVSPSKVGEVRKKLQESGVASFHFDVQSMNGAIANALSDNFNYICWACAIIVFLFLWFSLGSIELALLSFLPMAVSWVWILGIMGLLDIHFNIVNIILATFIFGQGDDYTIFMTEGASFEYAYRKKMLASYKSSIIMSALIMFVGIGSLIVAKHPALHSLAEVTIVGMFSVVLMAYLFPPLIFNFLVKEKKGYRRRPVTLKSLMVKASTVCVYRLTLSALFVFGFFRFVLSNPSESKNGRFGELLRRLLFKYVRSVPGVRLEVKNNHGQLGEPSVIVTNIQSRFAVAILIALSKQQVFFYDNRPSLGHMEQRLLEWIGFVMMDESLVDEGLLRNYLEKGYAFAVALDDDVSSASNQAKCQLACHIAESLNLDVIPMVMHGVGDAIAPDGLQVHPGGITVSIGEKEKLCYMSSNDPASYLYGQYSKRYAALAEEVESSGYFHGLALDRYRYKGAEILNEVKRHLSKYNDYSQWIDVPVSHPSTFIVDTGLGEFALLYALVHKDQEVILLIEDENKAALAKYSLSDVAGNVRVISSLEESSSLMDKDKAVYLVQPNEMLSEYFSTYDPIIIH